MLNSLIKELEGLRNLEQAKNLQRFFKTGKGEYGEGDIFLGIKLPVQREIAKKYKDLNLTKIGELLKSKIHEHRLIALIILVNKYKKSSEKEKEKIFHFYLNNTKFINNWDLVDLSSHRIIGNFLLNKDKKILYTLANSESLWERRIAIVSTLTFIGKMEFEDTLALSEILLKDKHDLIHKAVGWALREVGKKEEKVLDDFLKFHYKNMPRTMLRYAIEKFPEEKRKKYLNGKI
jgi:3-methyladenine DNA glycosylase AlkD